MQAYASHNSLKPAGGEGEVEGKGEKANTATPAVAAAENESKEKTKGGRRGFHIRRFSNRTHCNSSDSDIVLPRKSQAHPAVLAYRTHALPMENRYHLAVDSCVTTADGHAERATAPQIVAALGEEQPKIMIIGADKGYATKGFVRIMRWLGVMPHVAQNTKRSGDSAIDGRTTRHRVYKKSIDARPGIEKVFGWNIKEMDGQQQLKHRG